MNFKTFTGSTGKIYVWRSKRLSEEDISTPAISYMFWVKNLHPLFITQKSSTIWRKLFKTKQNIF